jgi:hypothetical protein
MESPEHERRDVIRYFEIESNGDATVEHAEKIASERIYGQPHDVWDVHATDGRWWVITNLTNLYSQDEFKSMDYVLSFHVGLMARMWARQSREAPAGEEEQDRVPSSWRRYEQAADALNEADEAEEFQAVGMRCREALLTFVREVADTAMVPDGEEPPKTGDFIHWTKAIANKIAAGKRPAHLRSYLKSVAKETWELVQWVTHNRSATRFDGEVAVNATSHVLHIFSMALVRFERGVPDRCPACGSYRLISDYRPELGDESPYVTLCGACGWEDVESRNGGREAATRGGERDRTTPESGTSEPPA